MTKAKLTKTIKEEMARLADVRDAKIKSFIVGKTLHGIKLTSIDVHFQGVRNFKDGSAQIWGYNQAGMNAGEIIILPHNYNVYTITEVVEKRDHEGNFDNPKKAKNAFFRVNCSVFNPNAGV